MNSTIHHSDHRPQDHAVGPHQTDARTLLHPCLQHWIMSVTLHFKYNRFAHIFKCAKIKWPRIVNHRVEQLAKSSRMFEHLVKHFNFQSPTTFDEVAY